MPSSMTLPLLSPDSSPLNDFKFQTILSLQHLFRIGTAMSVSWFTGTVAYLPFSQNSSTATLPIAQRAKIAGQAWIWIHTRLHIPDENDDDQTRDLWEEKHHAGFQTMGQGTKTMSLPDWEIVSIRNTARNGLVTPSFWIAEVEELPRGAGVEWAALSGVVGGPVMVCSAPLFCQLKTTDLVQLSYKTKDGSWTVEQCWFGNVVQSVVKVLFSNDDVVGRKVDDALESVGLEAGIGAVASWLDVTAEGIGSALEGKRYGGLVLCRSLRGAEGRRLAAVLVFETLA